MLDQRTRQRVQTDFQQLKPQLKKHFVGISDADLDATSGDVDRMVRTISQKTGTPEGRVASEIATLVGAPSGSGNPR